MVSALSTVAAMKNKILLSLWAKHGANDTLYWEIPITDVFSSLIMAHERNIPVHP